MKNYLISLSLVILCSFTNGPFNKNKIISNEFYYMINDDGTVNKDNVTEIRKITYNRKWEFISGTSTVNNMDNTIMSDAGKFYELPLVKKNAIHLEYDSLGRISIYKEHTEDYGIVTHFLRYDNRGNLTEDSSKSEDNNQLISITTYEYFYLNDFVYAERDDEKFISGMKQNFSNPWLNRTIRHNGKIVEYTERKIQNLR